MTFRSCQPRSARRLFGLLQLTHVAEATDCSAGATVSANAPRLLVASV
jgi:hypothetical protein